MKRVQVDITSNLSNVPNLEELLQKEYAMVGQWKEQGILEHLFVKENAKGAILVFKDIEGNSVKELIPDLPLSRYFVNIEYQVLDKAF